jgi:hypothetical protein
MRISKKKSIRLRNAPLKGARQIGSNMTEVEHGDLIVLYSYETPVAFLSPRGGYVTDKRWSVTTSKHIAKFFDHHGYDRKGAFKVPQEDIEMFVATGKGPQDFPINLDPTPKEMRDVVTRLLRRRGGNPRPRRTQRRVGLIKDVRFFRAHGGGVVGEATKGALDLARAEREMQRRGWTVEWVPDDAADWSWMDQPGFERERERDHEVYGAILKDRDGEQLASLWGIFDPDKHYMRVVEAELASEALAR